MIKRIEIVLGNSISTFTVGNTIRFGNEATEIKTKKIEIKKGKIIITFSNKSTAEYIGITQYSILK